MKIFIFLLFIFISGAIPSSDSHAKKIKNSFKIEKESKTLPIKDKEMQGIKINLSDTLKTDYPEISRFREIKFAGYDKEPNSNRESFLIINPTESLLTGFEVRIDYLDMKGRMLHSRNITEGCDVPPGETRRLDITSWDTQHTYYYYLGNEPKKVATPFQVSFTPINFWIKSL